MENIQNIHVAVDFSDNARAAYKFAKALAESLGAQLTLVHVFSVPLDPNSPRFSNFLPNFEELEANALKRLRRFANDKTVLCKAYMGFVADKLLELSQSADVDLMVVGSKGESGLLDSVFGTIALKMIQGAYCPVLVVPKKVKFKKLSDILYATAPESANARAVGLVNAFAKRCGAKLHFVHVADAYATALPDLSDLLKAVTVPYRITDLDFVSARGGIDYYRQQHPIDLVVAVTHHHGFWENLRKMSTTKSLTWNSDLPTLVLHREDHA